MVNNLEIVNISHHFLPFLIYNPLISIILITFSKKDLAIRSVSLISALLNIFVCLHLLISFDYTNLKPQFTELSHWLVFINLDFSMGVTGISLLIIFSISIIIFLMLLYESGIVDLKKKTILILLASTSATGYFSSLNTILMFFFLIVLIFVIYLFAVFFEEKERGKILFFALLTSTLFFLAAIVITYAGSGSFYLPNTGIVKMVSKQAGLWIFILVTISAVIMFSLFPFHITAIQKSDSKSVLTNVLISSIVYKIGIYNFIHFCIPFNFNVYILYFLASVALLTFFYTSILAFTRRSVNELFSYIMISHGSISFAGALFLINDGITGCILHILNMGFIIPGLFFSYGLMYKRSKSSSLNDNRALSAKMPVLSIFIIFFALSLIGFPVTGTFISEFLIVSGGLKKNMIIGSVIISGLILSSLYVLNFTRKMIWGDSDINILNFSAADRKDLNFQEISVLLILTLLIIFNGLFPKVLIDIMKLEIASVLKMKII